MRVASDARMDDHHRIPSGRIRAGKAVSRLRASNPSPLSCPQTPDFSRRRPTFFRDLSNATSDRRRMLDDNLI